MLQALRNHPLIHHKLQNGSEFLGVRPETIISASENESKGTMRNISMDTIRRWPMRYVSNNVDAETGN